MYSDKGYRPKNITVIFTYVNIERKCTMFNIEKYMISEEAFFSSVDDIYYNYEKWESGKSNICFITGISGSGKTSIGWEFYDNDPSVEFIELDDLFCVKDHFTLANLKEYGSLIYSYFTTVGKRFYVGSEILEKLTKYEETMYPEFLTYAKKYAKSHKNKRFVIEGVSLYVFTKPEEYDDYPVFIKGTSVIKSTIRASIRDSQKLNNRVARLAYIGKEFFNQRWRIRGDKKVEIWRNYFYRKMNP